VAATAAYAEKGGEKIPALTHVCLLKFFLIFDPDKKQKKTCAE